MRQDMFFSLGISHLLIYMYILYHMLKPESSPKVWTILFAQKKLRSLVRCGLGPCLESKEALVWTKFTTKSLHLCTLPPLLIQAPLLPVRHCLLCQLQCLNFTLSYVVNHGRSVSKTCSQVVEPPMWKSLYVLWTYVFRQIGSSPQVNLDTWTWEMWINYHLDI